MPIKPENRKRYPANWKQIRADILERAGHKCEFCGVPNYSYRIKSGEWTRNPMQAETWCVVDGEKVTRIVLTVAHLDHTPENCDPDNLRALCQRCHLRYDAEHHKINRAATRKKGKAKGDLFA